MWLGSALSGINAPVWRTLPNRPLCSGLALSTSWEACNAAVWYDVIKAWTHRRPPPTYKNHRFPVEIISHAVWLYFRFCLSFRDVEELLCERGITVTYEAIRKWCRKFGQQYANQLRRRRPRPGDKWHLDEMVLTLRVRPGSS